MKSILRSCLILMLIALLLPSSLADAETVTLPEASLDASSSPDTILAGEDGRVYVIDVEQAKIWRIDPASGSYEQYNPAGGGLSDAAPDGAGKIWWTSGSDTFGYFDITKSPKKQAAWQVKIGDNAPDLGPLQIYDNKIWMASWFSTSFGILRFDPQTRSLCHYAIPGGSYATDLVAQGGSLWWLKWSHPSADTLMRLNMTTGVFTSYNLNRNINLQAGLVVDQENLWWAEDTTNGRLARFNTTGGDMTTYSLPAAGAHPVKVSALNGRIWYTDAGGSFGSLDPQKVAVSPTFPVASIPSTITPACPTLDPASPQDASPETGTLTWGERATTFSQPQAGWEVYTLPASVPSPSMLGIAAVGNSIWAADDGRDKLLRLNFGYNTYLPIIRK